MPGGKGNSKNKKKYLDVIIKEGKASSDVWPILPLTSSSKERVGWDTQKPLVLLEKIIQMASKKGDLVGDFFCGCGTTLVAAHKLDRKYIGVDNSPKASKVIRQRLNSLNIDVRELAVKTLTKNQILELSPFEFQEYVIRCIGGEPNRSKVGDGGIDGKLINDGTPIQVKKSPDVGRPVLDSFYKHLKINNRGVIIALSFGKGAYEEVAKLKREGYDIELITLDDIMEMSLNKQAPKLERAIPNDKDLKKKVRKAA